MVTDDQTDPDEHGGRLCIPECTQFSTLSPRVAHLTCWLKLGNTVLRLAWSKIAGYDKHPPGSCSSVFL